MTEREKKILQMQSPSTQRNLTRPKSEDLAWEMRSIPSTWEAVPGAKTIEERVGARPLSFQEVNIEDGLNGLRRKRGKYIAELRKDGDAPSSVDAAKRNRAIDAFMFIKVKFKDLMRAWGLSPEEEKELIRIRDKKDEK